MTSKLAWKSFEKNLKSLKNSNLMSHGEYVEMYKTLDEYFQKQTWLLLTHGKDKNEFDLRPFLYGPKDDYDKPFLLTLIKMLVEVIRENDVNKQTDNLKRIYQWYKTNKILLDPNFNTDKEEISKKDLRRKSPVPVLQYTFRPNSSVSLPPSLLLTSSKINMERENTLERTLSPICNRKMLQNTKLLGRPTTSSPVLSAAHSPVLNQRKRPQTSPGQIDGNIILSDQRPNEITSQVPKVSGKTNGTLPNCAAMKTTGVVLKQKYTNRDENNKKRESNMILKASNAALTPRGIPSSIDMSKVIKAIQNENNTPFDERDSNNNDDNEQNNITQQKVLSEYYQSFGIDLEQQVVTDLKNKYFVRDSLKMEDIMKRTDKVGEELNKKREDNKHKSVGNDNSYLTYIKNEMNLRSSNETERNRSRSCDSALLNKASVDLDIDRTGSQYSVHFPQEKKTRTKTVPTSGPVIPDTIRYQWTESEFGWKTHMKRKPRIKKLPLYTRETKSEQSSRSSKRQLDPKVIASMMVVKHLGESANSSRSFSAHDDQKNAAQWIVEHPEMYLFDTEYIQFTKKLSYEQGYGYLDALGKRQIDLTVPSEKLHVSPNHTSPCYYSTQNVPANHDSDEDFDLENILLTDEKMKTNGIGLILHPRPNGQDISISDPSHSNYEGISSRLPHGASAKDVVFLNKTEAVNTVVKAPSISIERPKSCASCFKTSDFHHFCLDGEHEMDESTQLQRQINAAIDIQKIFRGHMVRRYIKELKSSHKQRQKKRADALSYAEKKYREHIRQLRENMEYREPNIVDFEFEKEYKAKKKQQELDRKQKLSLFARRQAMQQAKQNNMTKRSQASNNIHEIFHDNGPSKSEMKKAAIQIQKIVRGWLVRKHFQTSKYKAMKRTLDFGGFVHNVYITHLENIMKRHGVKNPEVVLQFNELLEYIERRNKYEVEFDRIVGKNNANVISFDEMKLFFEACGLHPSKDELLAAIKSVLKEKGVTKHDVHMYTKSDIVDITFQIYIPRGTNLKNTRKSTWMNPLINGEEAVKLIGKKGMEETDLAHCLDIVQKMMRERNDMDEKAIVTDLLPDDAKREGFEEYVSRDVNKGRKGKSKKRK